MTKPTVVFTRPEDWVEGNYETDEMKLVYVPLGGSEPKLRNGGPAGEAVGVLATHEGVDKLIQEFQKHKPEVFFHWVHYGEYDHRVMKELRKISPKTLFVFGQGNQVLHKKIIDRWIMENKEFVDVVLTNNYSPSQHKIMKDYGVKYTDILYDGFIPRLHGRPELPVEFDCFFGGGNTVKSVDHKGRFPLSKFRFMFINEVSKRFDLHVRGGGWNDIESHSYLYAFDYIDTFRKAKIVLGINHFDFERYYTKRTIYGGASGRMLITRYIPEMEKDFENHVNMVWFHSIDEALELIEYYLNNDEEREKIAKQTKEYFLKNHSWQARLRDFEGVMKRLKGVFNEW